MIKKIVTMNSEGGRKTLSKVCQDVEDLEAGKRVAKDLFDTARACKKPKAAGLAANQIGSDLRVVVIKYMNTFLPMINPVLKETSEQMTKSSEGCLSRPGMEPIVTDRYTKVTVGFTRTSGTEGTLKLKGMEAICIQHELDHLDGILI